MSKNLIRYSQIVIRCSSGREVTFNPVEYNEIKLVNRLEKLGETIVEVIRKV